MSSCCLAVGALGVAVDLRAEGLCEVRLSASSGGEAWSSAVRDLEAALADEASDCGHIVVRVAGSAATVHLMTRDGRTAERWIASPSELGSLVHAMLVAAPGHVAEPQMVEPDVADPPPPLAFHVAEPALPVELVTTRLPSVDRSDPPPTEEDAGASRLLVGAGGGMKGGAPGTHVAPVGQVAGSAALGPWELGGFGRWEPERELHGGSGAHATYAALGGGLTAGRRDGAGPFWLISGATLGIYAAEEERRPEGPRSPRRHVEDSFTEPRVGLYLGAVAPRASRVRVRAQVDADLAVLPHVAPDLPRPPGWGVGFTVSAETRLAP